MDMNVKLPCSDLLHLGPVHPSFFPLYKVFLNLSLHIGIFMKVKYAHQSKHKNLEDQEVHGLNCRHNEMNSRDPLING